MIVRKHYRGTLKEAYKAEEVLKALLDDDRHKVEEAIRVEQCLTIALYRDEDRVFLYIEALDEALQPERLFPNLTKALELWPEMEGKIAWSPMYHIYYHALPESMEQWTRRKKKIRRGRVARLLPEKLFSYVYHHQAIVDEGLLNGDQYQSIALHGNLLFSYFEEPRLDVHIRKDLVEESEAIKAWLAVDPESHFDHDYSGEGNFKFITELFSMGREDLEDELSI